MTERPERKTGFRFLPAPSFFLAALFGVALLLLFSCYETRASLTRKRIKSVERGLLRSVYFKGQKPEKLSLLSRLEFYRVPGVSLAVLDAHKIEWVKAYGVKSVANGEFLAPDSFLQAGGLSRSVAAAAVIRLAEEGRLDLDGDLSRRAPPGTPPPSWAKEFQGVSLRDLLVPGWPLLSRFFPGYSRKENLPTIDQILRGEKPAKELPVAFDSGARPPAPEYSYVIVQKLMEEVTSRPFPEFAREAVLVPAGMKNSTFDLLLPGSLESRAATGHLREGAPLDGKWLLYPEQAALGLWTTPEDLSTFALEIMNAAMGKPAAVLSAARAREMLTPRKDNGGLGFFIDGSGESLRFHLRGATRGFSAFLVVYPYKGQGAAIMTNSDNGPYLTEEILRALSQVYQWTDFKPEEKPLYKLDASITKEYAGRYEVTPEYFLDVTPEEHYLVIRPTGQAPTKFYVESETIFFSLDPFIRIQFRRDEKGKVSGLFLWQGDFQQQARKVG